MVIEMEDAMFEELEDIVKGKLDFGNSLQTKEYWVPSRIEWNGDFTDSSPDFWNSG